MRQRGHRKCLECGEWFDADPRNYHHQRYCNKPACRQASHAASQRRWLAKPENRDYFRGPQNVARVQAWRAAQPKASRSARPKARPEGVPLQEDCNSQPIETEAKYGDLKMQAGSLSSVLQDVLAAQPLVLVGLIAHLIGSCEQDDLAASSRRLLELGQDILGRHWHAANQTVDLPGTGPPPPAAF